MSKMNKRRGVYCRVSWQGQETVASPSGPGVAPTLPLPHEEGIVVVYVQMDASVDDGTGSHEEKDMAYAKIATSDGYSKDVVRVYREAWSGAPFDSPQLAELRRLSADGGLEALYVCWNDRVSRDPGGLARLLREFVASGVPVELVNDPLDPESRSKWRHFLRRNENNHEEEQHAC